MASGAGHGGGLRRVLGPDRRRFAFRRSPYRLVQNLLRQPVTRTVQVGAGRGPLLRGAHRFLRSGVAPLLGGGVFLITACVGEEGG